MGYSLVILSKLFSHLISDSRIPFFAILAILFDWSIVESFCIISIAFSNHPFDLRKSRDFLKSKGWFEKAIEIIQNDSTIDQSNKIANIAKKGIRESDIRWENNFDNITNEYPIFPILTKTNTTYEFYDDPDVVATTSGSS